jgi:hypothetical protein
LNKDDIKECEKSINEYNEQNDSFDFNVDNILLYDKKIKTEFEDGPYITYIGIVMAK